MPIPTDSHAAGHRRSQAFLLIPFLFASLLFATSCAHVLQPSDMERTQEPSSGPVAQEPFRIFSGEYELTPAFKQDIPQSVAVLPFTGDPDNWSVRPEGMTPPQALRRAMYNHLSSLPFRDMEMYSVDDRLASMGLTDPDEIARAARERPADLYRALGVDAVVTGEVTWFERIWLAAYSQVLVGCDLEMYSLPEGKLLWRARHTSRSHGGSLPTGIVSLAVSALSALWNVRETQLLIQTDNLFREIVATIDYGLPAEMRMQGPMPPAVHLFVCLNQTDVFREGDTITFRLVGPPGLNAVASLPGYAEAIRMTPVPDSVRQSQWEQTVELIKTRMRDTGHAMTPELETAIREELAHLDIYEGGHSVLPGEEYRDLVARATVSYPGSTRDTEATAPGRITVDSRPPAMPTGLAVESLDNRLRLTWAPNQEADLGGYEIQASNTAISGFSPVGSVESPTFILDSLRNFSTLHLKVRAVDNAGNTGPFSAPMAAAALPEPGIDTISESPQMLGGLVSDELRLTGALSPYTVRSTLTIGPGGALYIEPGVNVLFAPGTAILASQGAILAYGQADRPIRFAPLAESAGPGAYTGLVLDHSPRAILEHVRIDRAATGIRISASAPEIRNVDISRSSQAAIHLMDRAEPSLSCSRLHDNQGMGALVVEGVGPAPDFHANEFTANAPFHVQNFSPVTLNMSRNFWGPSGPRMDQFLGGVLLDPALSGSPLASGECVSSP